MILHGYPCVMACLSSAISSFATKGFDWLVHHCSLSVACKALSGTWHISMWLLPPLLWCTIHYSAIYLWLSLYNTNYFVASCTSFAHLMVAVCWHPVLVFLLMDLIGAAWDLSICGLTAACPICILAACNTGGTDLACLEHSRFFWDCKSLLCGDLQHSIRENCRFSLDSMALDNTFLTSWTYCTVKTSDWWQFGGLVMW